MLLSAGLRPTVLVRDPSRLDAVVRERVDAVAVDQGDGGAVVAATDVNAVFWIDPPNTWVFFTNLLLQLDAVRAGVLPVVQPVDQPMTWVAPRDIAECQPGCGTASSQSNNATSPRQHRPRSRPGPTTSCAHC